MCELKETCKAEGFLRRALRQNRLLLFLLTAIPGSSASSRKFFEVFRKFFEVFASFLKFSGQFGPVWTCLDLFGCVRMHSDASGCVRVRLEIFKKIDRNDPKTVRIDPKQSQKQGGYRYLRVVA